MFGCLVFLKVKVEETTAIFWGERYVRTNTQDYKLKQERKEQKVKFTMESEKE